MPFVFNPFTNNLDEVNTAGSPGAVTTLTGTSGGGAIAPVAGNINIAGAFGVSVTGAGNTLTVAVAGNTQPWNDAIISGNALKNNGYFAVAPITLTLPASVGLSDGDFIDFIVDAAGPLVIQAGVGQTIRLGTAVSGVAGTATSTFQGDAISLIYRHATTTWLAWNSVGTWIIV